MPDDKQKIHSLLLSILKAFESNTFKNYIHYIRFPFYKNLQIDSKIDFSFPLTVLVGPNGSGKSSALQAIYGMPEGYSTGIFWFATKVDPIEDDSKNRPGFVYGYKNDQNNLIEVVKTRIGTSKGGHYWEPSRPLKKWGMIKSGENRNPTIVKNVLYLDFRSELSAYDKFFYFSNFKATKTIKSKQDSIRIKSKHLKNALDKNIALSHRKRKIKQPLILSAQELYAINNILGKNYIQCKLVYHDLYSANEGLTIYFKTDKITYTEAFAGRGEFAVVKLVHEIAETKEYSLVLLDEPEVSLHPGAQERLLEFLLQAILEKKLQVVISTHSPKFVEALPEKSIKLFYPTDQVRFGIKNNCHFIEAFQAIGHQTKDTTSKIIYVEDWLLKTILENILENLNVEMSLIFEIRYLPGGAEDILKRAATYIQDNEKNKFIILDGDKEYSNLNTVEIPLSKSNDLNFLTDLIKQITNIQFNKLSFSFDSKHGKVESEKQKCLAAIQYIEYLKSNLKYLPNRKRPEELIWDEDFVNRLLESGGNSKRTFSSNNKENILSFTKHFTGEVTQSTYETCCKLLISNFIKMKNDEYSFICSTLDKFKLILNQ